MRAKDTNAVRVIEHEWDDDGVCVHCGFDGAEWAWWKTTWEGKANPERRPECIEREG